MTRGTAFDGIQDWLEFPDVKADGADLESSDIDASWRVHVPFMLSSWQCMYGNGCPGLFGAHESKIAPDVGCCRHGAWITTKKDYEDVRARIEELTDEDWDKENRDYLASLTNSDPLIVYRTDDEEVHEDGDILQEENYNAKTRVKDFGCVFANRSNGSVGKTGKIGCAFHHLGQRTGRSHVEVMPDVCWQLPLRVEQDEEHNTQVLIPWDADQWGDADEDGTMDSRMKWWCVDTNDAYLFGKGTMVYQTLREELVELMGQGNYDRMVEGLEQRIASYGWKENHPAMPAAVSNDGRPMLPLLVGNRQPRR